MNLLVLNTGSSSLKFALFDNEKKILSGKCERIGGKSQLIMLGKEIPREIKNYAQALGIIKEILERGNLKFDAIAHRVVHGGPLSKPSLITPPVEKIIKKYAIFAPLHNPPALEVIKLCKKFRKKQYAVFDTSFFQDLPEKAYTYPIPQDIAKKFNIKRYGFHGTSHKYVSKGLKGRIISCHLGSGASIAAITDGKAVDISLGLTPLEGIMMGTRAGDLDPGIVLFLDKKGYNTEKILNFESGFKAFLKDFDFREVKNNLGNKKIKLAYDIFIYRIIKYIGAYYAVLGGLDNLVFTAGIAENVPFLREDICTQLKHLGIEIDSVKNNENQEIISSDGSAVKVYVKKTDEEQEIAKEVKNV